jgi:hypothetical protein
MLDQSSMFYWISLCLEINGHFGSIVAFPWSAIRFIGFFAPPDKRSKPFPIEFPVPVPRTNSFRRRSYCEDRQICEGMLMFLSESFRWGLQILIFCWLTPLDSALWVSPRRYTEKNLAVCLFRPLVFQKLGRWWRRRTDLGANVQWDSLYF